MNVSDIRKLIAGLPDETEVIISLRVGDHGYDHSYSHAHAHVVKVRAVVKNIDNNVTYKVFYERDYDAYGNEDELERVLAFY